MLLVGEGVDPGDEQVVVANGKGQFDRTLQRRDRAVDERQAGRSRMPAHTTELVAAGRDRCAGEAVRHRLLVLAQDVDRVTIGGAHRRRDFPPAVQGNHYQWRFERDRAERVHRDAPRPLPLQRRDHRDAGRKVTHHLAKRLGHQLHLGAV